MGHITFPVAAAPCFIMALAGMAMFILSSTLARTRHARLWALSFALYTLGQAQAVVFPPDARPFFFTILINLAVVTSLFLYLGGFQQRRGRLAPRRLATIAVLVFLVQIYLARPSPPAEVTPFAHSFLPLTRMLVFLTAASYVTSQDHHSSATERSVTGMLIVLAFSNLALVLLAKAQAIGLVPPTVFADAIAVLGTPISAAIGLFTLTLIASDFSRERLRLIHTDPLTSVYNRLGFEQNARAAIARARPPRRPLTLVLADIDRFKVINDHYGHLTGDAALASFARYLIDAMPWPTLVGRFGGEEFALLIAGRDAVSVAAQTEFARANLSGLAVPGNREVALTASFGVAELLPNETLHDLYARADAALYLSKQEGRNRTSIDPGRAT